MVLRGPTTGAPVSEAGLRALFRRHRSTSGAVRVRPHRLRHTYGTELAAAGIDLLALRELMGHASPETTGRYVHLSTEHLAAEYAANRATGRSARSARTLRAYCNLVAITRWLQFARGPDRFVTRTSRGVHARGCDMNLRSQDYARHAGRRPGDRTLWHCQRCREARSEVAAAGKT